MSIQLIDTVKKYFNSVKFHGTELNGLKDTDISFLQFFQTSIVNEKIYSIYEPSMCVAVQGSKDVILEEEIYTYSEGNFVFTSINIPVWGIVTKASNEKPFISLVLKIDPAVVFEIQKHMSVSKSKPSDGARAMLVGKMGTPMTDAVLRLVECLDNPSDISILSPLIYREIIYRLLSSEHGAMIAQMGVIGSKTQKIIRAVEFINSKFKEKLDMNNVAKITGMSTSHFFKTFKAITGMSPLSYQKKIRLQEAKQLLISTTNDAATVSYLVGYESPSQFSREYSSLFGLPPKADINLMRTEKQ